jgi:hypothetical protein
VVEGGTVYALHRAFCGDPRRDLPREVLLVKGHRNASHGVEFHRS